MIRYFFVFQISSRVAQQYDNQKSVAFVKKSETSQLKPYSNKVKDSVIGWKDVAMGGRGKKENLELCEKS